MRTVDLTSHWEFLHPENRRWFPARVPGCVHTDLLRHGLIPDPFHGVNEHGLQWIERLDWTYRTAFDLPADLLREEEVELVCEGLDTLATLVLNGETIGRTENMFCGHRFPVRPQLRPGRNVLEITFANTLDYLRAHEAWQPVKERNDPVGGRSRIRKEQCQYSWDWGPRFVTCGIWRPLRLEAWSRNRLADVQVRQRHATDGTVTLLAMPAPARPEATARFRMSCSFGDAVIGEVTGPGPKLSLGVPHPRLWWPAGQGDQPLYLVRVELLDAAGAVADVWQRRIGLRTVELVREKDPAGESFFFRVNGRAVFAKGANWIPDHAFVTECTRERYADRLRSAVGAHMNMLRVWGGGVYEADDFYDLCDELGLLVWQDFMFACALYPGAPEYCELVRAEAVHQVRRLRHHACLALWCGNNEIPMMDILFEVLRRDREKAGNYARIFHEVLPQAVAAHDGVTPYWPSSPWTPPELFADANAPGAGDVHYWEVWHARAPVKSYERLEVRFCSEFGMQSYPSAELAATFCPPESLNVFSPVMESHQKHGSGNAIMLHYMAQRYRYASGYRHLAYLSQLNQAWCMKVGIEHFRHRMPFTMGALYWQINDCWPVASWSSIEFGGQWKALQYEARRFFAPSLVYLHTPGDVEIGRYNRVTNTIDAYEIFTVHDGSSARPARLVWSLRTLAGRRLGPEHSRDLTLTPGESVQQAACALTEAGAEATKESVYLRAELQGAGGEVLSRQAAFFTVPRFIDFADPKIQVSLQPAAGGAVEITLQSASLAPAVAIGFGALAVRLSDNWFDLHAGEPHRVTARPPAETGIDDLRAAMTVTSLWHSYQ
ncbi:MAG: glycoside hydrolase family 2 protein [Opitutaceae bacterium]